MVYIIQTENMCYKEVWKNIKRNWKKAIQKNRINDIIYNENRRMKKSYKITKIITIKLYFAGATSITVEIRNGGISYIRVTDNGKGIMQDDLEIAFERHATSKLRSAEDLDDIKSMGFRGEALASIASIAKVTLDSKTADSYTGYEEKY